MSKQTGWGGGPDKTVQCRLRTATRTMVTLAVTRGQGAIFCVEPKDIMAHPMVLNKFEKT